MKASEFIDSLRDAGLAGVSFVQDYMELLFDGPIIRFMVPPVVCVDNKCIPGGDVHWRNALCSLIGKRLIDIEINNYYIKILFEGYDYVKIEFSDDEPEFVHFVPGKNLPLLIW